MKLFIKQNFLYFISFFICIIVVFIQYQYAINQWNETKAIKESIYANNCSEYTVSDYENVKEDKGNLWNCSVQYELLHQEKVDTYYIYFSTFYEFVSLFPFFTILFVIIPAIYQFHIKTKNGNLKNQLSRIKYNDFVKKEYIKSLKSIIIVPICLIFLFILCYNLSGHFDIDKTIALRGEIHYTYNSHFHPVYYMFIYFVNIILQCIFFVNLVYIVDYKSERLILTYIKTYIVFMGLQIFSEILRKIIVFISGTEGHYYVYLTNYWTYGEIDKYMIFPTALNILLISITIFILYKIYNKKEKVLIINE